MELGFVMFLLGPALLGLGSGYTTDYYMSAETSAVDHSCLHNCGYNLGWCSCSSSCQYYGNCCRDYYDHCFTTTATTVESTVTTDDWLTEDYVSCRDRCGQSGALCSCSSSCQYFGGCCHDYYHYCSSLTTDNPLFTTDLSGIPGGEVVCGGNLIQPRGEFFSPRYPGNYPNNARCTWTLLAGELQVVSVNFTFVQLESCCDFIRVYDGPNAQSSLLASVTGNQVSSFNSRSRYMTVVFSTDHSVTYGGFRAEYTFELDHSCLHNCGYNLGWCSCSSSCQYYGNCCRDYYDHCFTTTATTVESTVTTDDWLTEDYVSCRDRCGQSGALCSCSSSCQYFGGCCHDYYHYCSSLTTDNPLFTTDLSGIPGGEVVCGGNLIQPRGEFFSPRYPGNYPNNARCTWTLLAGELQVVSVNFTFVQLESCCDFIRVYDGPNAQSSLLASVTGNQVSSFNSRSRYMTVVFSTDHSVTYGGFRAEYTFESAPTCRGQCGTSNSKCSCEASCVRNGTCCQDYNDYCSYMTSAPVPACGGSRYGSGSISSPYYPNYYHDNAYCVWQLLAPAGQTIFLSFQDFDLDRCCNCDYVNVYDGPSTASRLIGKLCHNNTNHLDFQSSSSYMTVLFRSDFSGVGRGFKAHFSSSLNKNTARVDCTSDWMNISIQKSYLDSLGFSWHDLYLDDHRCRPSADYYYVTFNFPIHSCSTRRKMDNGRIIYFNNVRAAQSTSGEITRHDSKFLMLVNCVMERDSSVGTIYEAKEITNATISGTGRFNTTMAFYPSSSFSYPITESPYRVNLDQQLYVQVQLSQAEPSLHLFIDSCMASPNHDFSSRTYVLISNGCRRDSTVYVYSNGNRYFAQFRFRAFKFLRTHNQVFLRCDVVICADNDYNSRCRQGCRNRRKRSLSSDHHTEVITLGPITLKGPEEAVAKKEDEE